MSKLLYLNKESENTSLNISKKDFLSNKHIPIMTKEDYEFLEDMISNSDLATEEECEFDCDDGFCITKDNEIKVSPKNKDFYYYLKGRNNNKSKKQRKNHLIIVK